MEKYIYSKQIAIISLVAVFVIFSGCVEEQYSDSTENSNYESVSNNVQSVPAGYGVIGAYRSNGEDITNEVSPVPLYWTMDIVTCEYQVSGYGYSMPRLDDMGGPFRTYGQVCAAIDDSAMPVGRYTFKERFGTSGDFFYTHWYKESEYSDGTPRCRSEQIYCSYERDRSIDRRQAWQK